MSLTYQQIGDGLGISKQAVAKLVAKGMPRDAVESARLWREKNLRQSGPSTQVDRPKPPPTTDPIEPDGAPNYFEERARRERALAGQAEMEAAKMRGELVSAEDVARQWAVEAARIREQLLQFAERMAPMLEMRPLGFVRQKMDAEVRQILEGLAA